MSPEAIHSLIEMFGVEKGLQILNLFTAMDDTELSHQQRSTRPAAVARAPRISQGRLLSQVPAK